MSLRTERIILDKSIDELRKVLQRPDLQEELGALGVRLARVAELMQAVEISFNKAKLPKNWHEKDAIPVMPSMEVAMPRGGGQPMPSQREIIAGKLPNYCSLGSFCELMKPVQLPDFVTNIRAVCVRESANLEGLKVGGRPQIRVNRSLLDGRNNDIIVPTLAHEGVHAEFLLDHSVINKTEWNSKNKKLEDELKAYAVESVIIKYTGGEDENFALVNFIEEVRRKVNGEDLLTPKAFHPDPEIYELLARKGLMIFGAN